MYTRISQIGSTKFGVAILLFWHFPPAPRKLHEIDKKKTTIGPRGGHMSVAPAPNLPMVWLRIIIKITQGANDITQISYSP